MNKSNLQAVLRKIPAVDQLLLRPAIAQWVSQTSREFVVAEIQKMLQEIRSDVRSGSRDSDIDFTPEHLELILKQKLQIRLMPNLRMVVNATGVILHTNLGRAPVSPAAQKALSAFSGHYTNLEYEILGGRRSHRDKMIEPLLQEILGCEAATVVNNNAAAVFLILNSLASGREVVVSRGELVEIGGSFRIPDIMMRSGALLREVGTTNKTRIQDYRDAIGPNTALLLRVHPSNFKMVGFTQRPELHELVDLSRAAKIPLVEDIGSGCLVDLKAFGISGEPLARESLAAGVDVICFSGDKLLGGPQAGIIAGTKSLIDPIRKNPLMRTYRVDKLIYSALEATLGSYRFGKAAKEIPVVRMIAMTGPELKKRSQRFLRKLRAAVPDTVHIQLSEGNSLVGGGSCPEYALETTIVAVESSRISSSTIESRLRFQDPPIIIRLEEDKALIDLRTVFPEEESILIEGLRKAVASR
ncbi:MAG: L-seryl-tRNA(Sec) selenium transferase [Acidobacteria bacterium]|nr:L-seryl-tRNA(Sec) selenium transferase [Acidobacteriota bacterium]